MEKANMDIIIKNKIRNKHYKISKIIIIIITLIIIMKIKLPKLYQEKYSLKIISIWMKKSTIMPTPPSNRMKHININIQIIPTFKVYIKDRMKIVIIIESKSLRMWDQIFNRQKNLEKLIKLIKKIN